MRNASIMSVTTTALVAIAPVCAWAQPRSDGYGYWGHSQMMSGMMSGGGWIGMICASVVMLLILAALVAVVVFVARGAGRSVQGSATHPSRTPLDILKERFARGEIDKEEFEDRRRVLGD